LIATEHLELIFFVILLGWIGGQKPSMANAIAKSIGFRNAYAALYEVSS